jgi:alkanesulfonate monooxygenase
MTETAPPINVLWYMIHQDGRYPWDPTTVRKVDYPYFQALGKSLDHLGYDGALLATGTNFGPDPWLTAASLIPLTERLKFLVAVHPSLISPVKFAKLAGTLDDYSRGRLLVNIISGAGSFAHAGVHLDHDERYRHTDEFLTVYKRLAAGEQVDFDGEFVKVDGAIAPWQGVQRPHPPLWFGGSSDPAIEVSAKHIDTYLTWGEPLDQAAEKIGRVRDRAAQFGRTIGFGIRLSVIVRETEEQAWAVAQDQLDHMSDDAIAAVRKQVGTGQSVGWERQQALHGWQKPKHARELEIAPNLWSGLALVRPGPGITLVGDPETVAKRIWEYQDIGFDTFIISNFPLVEEAYRVAEDLLPILRKPRIRVAATAPSHELTVAAG